MAELDPEQPNQPDREQVRDDMTGELVPADETIELHGYRVGPEGKQILMDRLQSGGPLESGAARPGFWRRVGCALLDWAILAVGASCVGGVAGGGFAFSTSGQGGPFTSFTTAWFNFTINGLVSLLVTVGYFAYFALQHAANGQTLGKRAGHLFVVNMDLSAIDSKTAWLRAFYLLGPYLVPPVIYMLAPLAPQPFAIVGQILSIMAFVYVVVDVIVGLADTDQQRALHDRWAGTRVIWKQDA